MIGDSIRTDAYVRALHATVRKDSVVVDIGTGLGIWALIACQAGARKVYAIEASDVIEVAKQIAKTNGLLNRVEFIQDWSTRVYLPEKADVIVSDVHGPLPIFGGSLQSLVDAQQRFLTPAGVMIPKVETLWAALVEAADLYESLVRVWDTPCNGIDMHACRVYSLSDFQKCSAGDFNLISDRRAWSVLDYASMKETSVHGQIEWNIRQTSVCHGLLLWFDCALTDSIGFSTGPGEPPTIFKPPFLPWSEPVPLQVGDIATVSIKADAVSDDFAWSWAIAVRSKASQVKHVRKQSTIQATPISRETLRRHSERHVPTANRDAAIDVAIVSMFDGKSAQGEIARAIAQKFPDRFSSYSEALTRVASISRRYRV